MRRAVLLAVLVLLLVGIGAHFLVPRSSSTPSAPVALSAATIPSTMAEATSATIAAGAWCRSPTTVTDASGGPVVGARIFLEGTSADVRSDAEGAFRLCLPPKSTRVRVEADGYGGFGRSIQGSQRLDVVLMPEASLGGDVVATETGAPVPWALVTLRVASESIRELVADANGHFEAGRLAPGSVTAEARAPGRKTHHPIDVQLFASSRASARLALDPRARLAGRVLEAGDPVVAASVRVGFSSTFEWATSVRTGGKGEFVIADAPLGDLFVEVGEHEVLVPKTVHAPGEVVLEVRSRAELVATVTHDGVPVSDAVVSVRGRRAETRTTNSAGVATFKNLVDGTYRVWAERDGLFAVQDKVQITRDARTSLELATARQIEGRVVEETGQGIDGARVVFVAESSTEDLGASATTSLDGTFRGGPLRGPASYKVRITRSGVDLDVKSGATFVMPEGPGPRLEIVTKARGEQLSGVVVDPSGDPVRDARVVVSRPERHAQNVAATSTSNDGAFSFHGLGAGPWSVKVLAITGSEAEVGPLDLPHPPLRIALATASSIEGTLKGFGRTPTVMAFSFAGYEDDFHVAELTGDRFSIRGLSAGRWHVAASTPETAAQADVELAGGDLVHVGFSHTLPEGHQASHQVWLSQIRFNASQPNGYFEIPWIWTGTSTPTNQVRTP